MIASSEYIRQKFEEYNNLIFEGKLPPLPIRLSNARTYIGQIRYLRKRKLLGGYKYSDFVFVVSNHFDISEREMEDTIIHEMIHYYILSNQINDSSAHGRLFRQLMNDINRRFGRNVTISHRLTTTERSSDTEVRQHLVCISRFRDGTLGVTVASKTRIFQLWDSPQLFPEVESYQWYHSRHHFFNRYRRALTPKIYRITQDDLDNIDDLKALKRDGSRITLV